ncbi:MAG: hypothetical protein HC777_01940 [Hyphomonadaceae bacterium]|nr:hypothetical protein [Hyphomonadaceae bacterium]
MRVPVTITTSTGASGAVAGAAVVCAIAGASGHNIIAVEPSKIFSLFLKLFLLEPPKFLRGTLSDFQAVSSAKSRPFIGDTNMIA